MSNDDMQQIAKGYKEEMSQVHAPKELIDITKLAMKKEMEIETKRKNNIVRFIPLIVAAAAAALVLMFVPNFFGQKRLSSDFDQPDIYQNQLKLDQFELAPDKITKGNSTAKELDIYIVENYPKEFLADIVEEEELEGIPVVFVKDDTTGFYKAVFSLQTQKYLVLSEIIDKDYIVKEVKDIIQMLMLQTED